MKFRVEHLQGDTYQVFEHVRYDEIITKREATGREWDDRVFQGSLSDCEAYIRLKQNETIDF